MSASKDHSRYPYTYSADMIRCVVGPDVSRSEAASLSKHIAVAEARDAQ